MTVTHIKECFAGSADLRSGLPGMIAALTLLSACDEAGQPNASTHAETSGSPPPENSEEVPEPAIGDPVPAFNSWFRNEGDRDLGRSLEILKELRESGQYDDGSMDKLTNFLIVDPDIPISRRLQAFELLGAEGKARKSRTMMRRVLSNADAASGRRFYQSLPPGDARTQAVGDLVRAIVDESGVSEALEFASNLEHKVSKHSACAKLDVLLRNAAFRSTGEANEFVRKIEDQTVRDGIATSISASIPFQSGEQMRRWLEENPAHLSRGGLEGVWRSLVSRERLDASDYESLHSIESIPESMKRSRLPSRELGNQPTSEFERFYRFLNDRPAHQEIFIRNLVSQMTAKDPDRTEAFGSNIESPEVRDEFFYLASHNYATASGLPGPNRFTEMIRDQSTRQAALQRIKTTFEQYERQYEE